MVGQRTVVLELAGEHQLARDLMAAGVFVPGEQLGLGEECALVLRGRSEDLVVSARAVWVNATGTGLQLVGCDADMKAHIARLAQTATAQTAAVTPGADADTKRDHVGPALHADIEADIEQALLELAPHDDEDEDPRASARGRKAHDEGDTTRSAERERIMDDGDDTTRSASRDRMVHDDATARDRIAHGDDVLGAGAALAGDDELAAHGEPAIDTLTTDAELETGDEPGDGDDNGDDNDTTARKLAPNISERLRGLTLVQQLKVAAHGELSERILLERMYGKNVWEALLRNPRITGPEVARIARIGSLPRPLLEQIVGNGGWLQVPEVRRALLGNPRLGTDQILRVLRLLPKHELKLASVQTAYPFAVRDAAKRMLRELAGS